MGKLVVLVVDQDVAVLVGDHVVEVVVVMVAKITDTIMATTTILLPILDSEATMGTTATGVVMVVDMVEVMEVETTDTNRIEGLHQHTNRQLPIRMECTLQPRPVHIIF